MIILANGISPQMFQFENTRITYDLQITRISGWQAGDILRSGPFVSVYGHADSAKLLSRYFRMPISVSRQRIKLTPEDRLIVASVQRSRVREIGYDRSHPAIFRFYLVRLKGSRNDNRA